MVIKYEDEIFNPSYYDFLNCQLRHAVVKGGANAAKSYTTAQKFNMRFFGENVNHHLLFIMKIQRYVAKAMFRTFKKTIDLYPSSNDLNRIMKYSEGNLEIKNLKNGNLITGIGCDDPEKLKSIEGVTSIWIEEANLLTKRDYEIIDDRMRGITGSYQQIVSTFNPIHEMHWLREYFELNIVPDCQVFNFTIDDNKFATKKDYENLERKKLISPNHYKIYRLGQWGTPENVIFNNYKTGKFPETDNIFYGLDFGYKAQTALVKCHVQGNSLYLKLLIYKGMNNKERIKALDDLKIDKYDYIYGDSANPEFIDDIYDAGYNIHKADKSVEPGIEFLQQFDEIIIDPDSQDLMIEFQGYQWTTDKNGNVIDGKPVKKYDHGIDSTRYAVFSHRKFLNLPESVMPSKSTILSNINKKKTLGINF